MKLTKLDNLLLKLASLGLSKKEISESLSMTLNELDKFIKSNEVLKEAFELNQLNADAFVMRSLFKRAVGSKRKVKKTRIVTKEEDGIHPKLGVVALKKSEKIEDETIEEVIGDVSAQKFWLTNRRPELFSDVSIDKIKAILEDS